MNRKLYFNKKKTGFSKIKLASFKLLPTTPLPTDSTEDGYQSSGKVKTHLKGMSQYFSAD